MLYKRFIFETERPCADACKNTFNKKKSENTGLQKNYILCIANLKKKRHTKNKPTDTTAAH